MPHLRLYAASIVLGLLAMIILGRLPMLEPHVQQLRKSAAGAAPHRSFLLSDENLVDAIAGVRLQHRLIRVGWEHAILNLDLALRDTASPEDLQQDIAELLRFAFLDTGNVRQVLIRVYRDADDRSALLLYGDLRREDGNWKRLDAVLRPGEAEPGPPGALPLKATPAGERWLRQFAK